MPCEVASRAGIRFERKKISRNAIAIILLIATVTPAAFHSVRAQSLTTSFTYTPIQPARTETITFTATSSGNPPFSFSWNFGDGSTASGTTVAHAYASGGTYEVMLAVTDSSLQTGFQTQIIIVTNYHGFSFGIASDIGNLNVGYANSAHYAPRQSLLRLGNTTGLSFFIADGWLADGYYYRNEAAWCGEFKAHYNNIVLVDGETDGGWTSSAFDDIVYDVANNGVYDNSGSGPDNILFNGWGGVSKVPGPVDGSPVSSDSHLVYWDANGNGQRDPGESLVFDESGTGRMKIQDPVMVGPIPPVGTHLSSDPRVKYFQRDTQSFYSRPESNNDFEQFVSSCGFPASLGTWQGSGISCSNALPGQPDYSFPSCYGREYYFDVGYPTPELRIIVISPSIQNVTGHMTGFGTDIWTYAKNDAHYNWVNQTIQAASLAGISQTMVVSFDQCLGTRVEECGQGYRHSGPYDSSGTKYEADLSSMLIDDLGPQGSRLTYLAQGEDIGYTRFYPLATHPGPAFTSDGLGCAWDSASGNHGFPLTSYFYNTGDIFPTYDPACFANPRTAGQPYAPWPGLAGQGVSPIISAAFGAAMYTTLNPGEILVKDMNGTGKYVFGDPYIGGTEPVPGTVLTGGQGTNSHIGFIDTNRDGQWEPGETLFLDANGSGGCTSSIACNGKYDPGETVFAGPVPNTQQPAAFNDSDVKLLDTNGNGGWDQLRGSPHNVLEAPYVATSMGSNTLCNNVAYSSTCPGHGWVSFTFNPGGNQTNIDTNFCIDGENPTVNQASCISPHVFKDKYVVVSSAQPIQKGFSVSASFNGVHATMSAYLGADPSIPPVAWITATNTSTAQVFVAHSATYLNVVQTTNGFRFVYQFNTTTSTNPAQPWLGFACEYSVGVSINTCLFERTPDIVHLGVVNILDFAQLAYSFDSRPGQLTWNPSCDLDDDGRVTILDTAYAAFFFDSKAFTA